jgi:DNA-binding CsgD family transcriptional regulator
MESFGDDPRQKDGLGDAPERLTRGVGGLQSLSPREREVLDALIAGETSKEIARRFNISPRTVEVHRAHILKKIGARNTADLLRRVLLDQTKS